MRKYDFSEVLLLASEGDKFEFVMSNDTLKN